MCRCTLSGCYALVFHILIAVTGSYLIAASNHLKVDNKWITDRIFPKVKFLPIKMNEADSKQLENDINLVFYHLLDRLDDNVISLIYSYGVSLEVFAWLGIYVDYFRVRLCVYAHFFYNIGLLIAAGIVVHDFYAYRDDTKSFIMKTFSDLIRTNYSSGRKDRHGPLGGFYRLWDTVQKTLHCCGMNNYTDFSAPDNSKDIYLPMSCCNATDLSKCTGSWRVRNLNSPCGPEIWKHMETNYEMVWSALVAIEVCLSLLLLISCLKLCADPTELASDLICLCDSGNNDLDSQYEHGNYE
ncbi:unnamed protein product [Protopolystoma xenopodis]|uniref:Tetraspanin n=1 Tax=Protopolystoma xenopodis TaxID=117903 RepID=A0A3S5B791_9PLAT|nr:unnamed protein product [Protopolystoma xenopodis]